MDEGTSGDRRLAVDVGEAGDEAVSPNGSAANNGDRGGEGPNGKGISGVFGYVNFSVLAFGIAAISTSLGYIILPLRVLDVADDSLKNTYLGLLGAIGMGGAMVIQPLVGYLSDKTTWAWGRRRPYVLWNGPNGFLWLGFYLELGRRRPYIALGSLVAVGLMVGVGASVNFIGLLISAVLVQLFINVSQTPYDAMLKDQVPHNQRGKMSSVRAIAGAAGAVLLLLITGFIMDHHVQGTRDIWLWISLGLPTGVLAITAVWTLALVRDEQPTPEQKAAASRAEEDEAARIAISEDAEARVGGEGRLRSLITALGVSKRNLTMLSAAFSYTLAGGILMAYTFYFLQDVVALEKPASGMSWLAATAGLAIILTLWPAGVLADRVGRAPLLYVSSALGGGGTLLFYLAQNLLHVVLIGIVLGVAAGLFFSAGRALITDMVSESRAALQMGLANFALVGGAGGFPAGRAAGGLFERDAGAFGVLRDAASVRRGVLHGGVFHSPDDEGVEGEGGGWLA